MYNSDKIADRIRRVAKEKRIIISKMLSDCHLGQNTLNNFKTSMPKSDNLAKIADYLDVSVDYLLGRTDVPAKEYINEDDIKFALFGGDKDEITDEEFEDVKRFANFILQKKRADKPNGEKT